MKLLISHEVYFKTYSESLGIKKMIEGDRELSAMVQELWDNDINRLRPGIDYRISLQVTLKSFLCEVHKFTRNKNKYLWVVFEMCFLLHPLQFTLIK